VLALALVGLVAREGVARAEGQEVRLAVGGYDPRSLLSGHYVQFQLSDRLPAGQVCRRKGSHLEAAPGGWLALRRNGDDHRVVAAATTRAGALRLGEIALRGEATCRGYSWVGANGQREWSSVDSEFDIGVDRLHLAQDEAEALDKALRDVSRPQDAHVVLSVGPDGRARLKGLIIAGRRTDLDWF
jgi:hypothetical protein